MTDGPPAEEELPELTDADRRLRDELLAQAEVHGTALVEVAGDADGAPYTFSVGAWQRYGVPEAVVIGLPEGMGATLVTEYVRRACEGEPFVLGQLYGGFFDDIPVVLERVARAHYFEFFGSAFLIYRRGDFPAVQLIVPTPAGEWPWQPDSPAGFQTWQPVLTMSGEPESWTPGVDGP